MREQHLEILDLMLPVLEDRVDEEPSRTSAGWTSQACENSMERRFGVTRTTDPEVRIVKGIVGCKLNEGRAE